MDQHVEFAPHAKFWQVDAWFDRAASLGQEQAFVARLKVLKVGTIAVFGGGDAMSCAMHKGVAIASLLNDASHAIIDFTTLNLLTRLDTLTHKSDASIPRCAYDLKDLALVRRDLVLRSYKGHPGII